MEEGSMSFSHTFQGTQELKDKLLEELAGRGFKDHTDKFSAKTI